MTPICNNYSSSNLLANEPLTEKNGQIKTNLNNIPLLRQKKYNLLIHVVMPQNIFNTFLCNKMSATYLFDRLPYHSKCDLLDLIKLVT